MKDSYYFSHDANARNDERVLELRAEFGWQGYGLFWGIVESMRDSADYRLNRGLIGGLSVGFNVAKAELQKLVDFCIEIGLFNADETHFWSNSLIRRMRAYDDLKIDLSQAGKRGAAKRWAGHEKPENGGAIGGANAILKERKGNKKKEREGSARPESVEQVKILFNERKYLNPDTEAEAFWNNYEANGWVMGKARAPIRNWKAASANWNKNAKDFASDRRPRPGQAVSLRDSGVIR